MKFENSGHEPFKREKLSSPPNFPKHQYVYLYTLALEKADVGSYHFAGIDGLLIRWEKDSITRMTIRNENGDYMKNEDLPEINKLLKHMRFEYRKGGRREWKAIPINAEIIYDNTDVLYNWYNTNIARPEEITHNYFRKNRFYDLRIVFETIYNIKAEANVKRVST